MEKKKKAKAKRKTTKARVSKKRTPVRRKKAARKKATARKARPASRAGSRHIIAALDKAGKLSYFNGAAYNTRANAVEFGSAVVARRMAGQLVRRAGAHVQAIGVFPSSASAERIREEFSKKR